MGVRRFSFGLRGAVLLPLGAYAVHQARYWLAFGDHANEALDAQGHAYLAAFATPLALLVAIGLGLFLSRVARAWHTGEGPTWRAGFLRTWLAATVLLVALYVGQETLEGLLTSGHPEGVAGILGGGGWIALPAAMIVGEAIAAVMWLGTAVVAWASKRQRTARTAPLHAASPAAMRRRRPSGVRRRVPLATRAAGRAPPHALGLTP
jgi:hypothetical protein